MEKITTNLKHSKETYLLALSRLFERAGYYGLRTLFIVYLIGDSLKLSKIEAFEVYGLFTISIYLSQLIGGFLGDFILKNKLAIIIGGVLEFMGCLIICIPSEVSFYIGIGFITIGAGLYSPNIIAQFGKLYTDNGKYLDAGYTIFYLAINLGAFIGIIIIGFLGEINIYYGFLFAAFFFVISTVIFSIAKNTQHNYNEQKFTIENRVIVIIFSIILTVLFWLIYELVYINFILKQQGISQISTLNFSTEFWSSLSQYITLFFSAVLIIIWTYFYLSQVYKLIIGFSLGVISFLLLYYIPNEITDAHLSILLLSIFLLGISELFIAPILLAAIAKYCNPKYLASIIGVSLFLIAFGNRTSAIYMEKIESFTLIVGIVVFGIISIALTAYLLIKKKLLKSTTKIL